MKIVIAMPVYDDWDSAMQLCQRIDKVFSPESQHQVHILLIDDGSASQPGFSFVPQSLKTVSALTLRRNLGHQRAIAVGLSHLRENHRADVVVVMDSDGEDRPEDILPMLAVSWAAPRPVAVFAERGRRVETFGFRMFYYVYLMLHRFLTSRDIRFGNFSVLPWDYLEGLVAFPELWNHYAATVVKSRLPYDRVRLDRGERLAGKSKMSFTNLVVHGLSALFANQELVGTRLLILNLAILGALILAAALVVTVKVMTNLAIPGWATNAMGLLLVLIAQSLIASILVIFTTMMNRSQLGFLPIRDYSYFVRNERTLFPQ